MFALDLGHYGTSPRFLITDGTPGGQTAIVFDNCRHTESERWYHIAGTYDGSTLRLYVDGEPVASVTRRFRSGPIRCRSPSAAGSVPTVFRADRRCSACTTAVSSDEIGALHDSFNPGQGG